MKNSVACIQVHDLFILPLLPAPQESENDGRTQAFINHTLIPGLKRQYEELMEGNRPGQAMSSHDITPARTIAFHQSCPYLDSQLFPFSIRFIRAFQTETKKTKHNNNSQFGES